MANIVKLQLSKDELMSLAERKLSGGEMESAINYLHKSLAIDDSFVEAQVKLANIYADLGAHQISNAVFFKALVSNPTPEQEDRIFYKLANNFLELGQTEVVAYYMRYFGDDFDPSVLEVQEDRPNPFHLVSNTPEDYYEHLIEKAYALVQERRFDEAVDLASRVDKNSRHSDAANHIILVSYMMKNDIDRVIYEAQAMLEKGGSLGVKSTLATALMIEERTEDAYKVVEDLLTTDYNRLEEILIILPLLVNLKMHSHIVLYTKKALKFMPYQPNGLIWLSQALYNLGQKDEAEKVMHTVENIYGEYSPADYFLDLYKTNPEEIDYSMTMPNLKVPHSERFRRYKVLEEYAKLSNSDLENALENNEHLQQLIRWAFIDGNDKVIGLLLDRLSYLTSNWLTNFYKEVLIHPGLGFDTMSAILAYFLDGGPGLIFSIVTQDRFKDVELRMPEAFYALPRVLKEAVGYSICDVIYTDEDPNTYLERLRNAVNGFVSLGEDGKPVYASKKKERVARLRNPQALAGVLLAYVYYDEDNPKEDSIVRYGINERTFDKYYKIIFGDDDDEI